ncbi:CinA family protein [Betaproteobacteria bacterium]|nr:CinA family protein [Betaproteobacteria bacterium]
MKKNGMLIKVLALAFFARKNGLKIAVAESCTSGLLACHLSSLAGSSAWFDLGIVCYSNLSKKTLLSVDLNSVESHGSVSKIVASQMLAGLERVLPKKNKYYLFSSITGIAGPTGGSEKKPRGLVWFGFQSYGERSCKNSIFSGSRMQIRNLAVRTALEGLISASARKKQGNN